MREQHSGQRNSKQGGPGVGMAWCEAGTARSGGRWGETWGGGVGEDTSLPGAQGVRYAGLFQPGKCIQFLSI